MKAIRYSVQQQKEHGARRAPKAKLFYQKSKLSY
jgi:hypothetical protein